MECRLLINERPNRNLSKSPKLSAKEIRNPRTSGRQKRNFQEKVVRVQKPVLSGSLCCSAFFGMIFFSKKVDDMISDMKPTDCLHEIFVN